MSSAEKQREAPPAEPEEGSAPAANGSATDGATGDATGDGASGESTSADWAERCANCGAALHGRYCHACGEKVVGPDDYALSRFLHRALSTLTHLDGSVFRTYYYLVAKPGFLATEHRAGRRKRYLKPLQVFIIVNVAFYLFASWTGLNTFDTPLQLHMEANNFFHDGVATRLVNAHLSDVGTSLSAYADTFNRWTERLSKTLIFTLIPVFAVLFKALHIRRRRYFVEHLVFACHFSAILLLLLMLTAPVVEAVLLLLQAAGAQAASLPSLDITLTWTMNVAVAAYLYFAFRRRYEQAAWLAFLKSVALAFSLTYVILLYRALLFFVAFFLTT